MQYKNLCQRHILRKLLTKGCYMVFLSAVFIFCTPGIFAQGLQVSSCPSVDKRNNGNGQASLSAGDFPPIYSQNNPVTTNVVGTPYQYVSFDPATKTGSFTFIWSSSYSITNFPVITRIWYTPPGSTVGTLTPIVFGPPGPPTVVGQDFYVTYSFYFQNISPSGIITMEFTDPQTSVPGFTCSYALNNNSSSTPPTINCKATVTTQPSNLTLCGASTAGFTMAASGASVITWQVSTNGGSTWTSITNGGNYSGATTATLSIANPTTYDGDYYRAYLTGASGCGDTFTTAAQLIAKPKPTAAFTSTVQCGTGTSSLGVNLTGTFPWSITYTTTPSGGSTTPTTVSNIIANPFYFSASPSITTTYVITAISDQYCTNGAPTGSVSQTIYAKPTVTPGNATTCYGTGTFNLAYTSTQSPNKYTLTAGTRAMSGFTTITNATLSSSPIAITIPSSTPAGVYDFNLSVSNTTSGCISASTVPFTVTVVANPTVTATAASASVCTGTSSTLTAAPATLSSYSWSLNPSSTVIATGVSPSVTVNANSTYTVTATDANSCSATATVSVTALSGPSLTVSASASTICSGVASILTATGGNTYTWSPATGLSSISGSHVIASPSSTTTYTVTSRDTASCPASGTVTITVSNPTISVTSGSTICSGTIKTLTATGGSTYSWYPTIGLYTDASATTAYTGTSLATVYAKPTATSTYTVVGTNSGGCSGTATSTVTISAAPVNASTSTPNNLIFCTQGTTSFVLEVYPTSIVTSMAWSYSTDNVTYTNVTTVTSPTGVTLTPATSTDSASLTLSAYGSAGYSGPTYFRMTIVSGGCTYLYNIFITDTKKTNPTPAPTPSATTICSGNSVTLTIGTLASGSTAQWQSSTTSSTSGFTNISGATSASYTASPITTTYYQVVFNGGTGNCGAISGAATVTVGSALTANTVTPATTCTDGHTTVTLSGSAITGGIYQWQSSTTSSTTGFANILGATGQNYTLPADVVATPTWYWRIANTSICASNTSTAVVVYPPLSGNLITTSDTSFCASAPALALSGATPAGGSGTYTYQWISSTNGTTYSNIGGATSVGYTTTTASQTEYYKRIVSSGGCLDTTTYTWLKVNANPTVSVTSGSTVCAGTAVALSASGALTYTWSPATDLSATTGSGVTSTPTASRTYTVTGTNVNRCTASASVTITATALPSTPTLSAASQTICSGSVSLTSKISTGTSPQWYTAPVANALYSVSTPATVSTAGTYYTFASSGGCYSAGYASFTLNVANVTIPVPSATALSYCAPATADLTALQPSAGTNTSLEWHTVSSGPSAGNLVSTPTAVSSGTYYLYAYSSAGSCYGTASSAVTITINSTSSATVSSTSASACVPSTVNLTSYNTTSGTNTYNWYTSSTPSPSTEVAFPAQISQSGTYYLFATSSAGCQGAVSPGVVVTINPQPTAGISSPTAFCGAVSRTITATTNATSPSYQWAISTNGGSSWTNLTNTSPYSGITTSALTINPTTGLSGDYYRYTVTASSGCSAVSSPAVLVQESTPVITSPPSDTSVVSGATVYFIVSDTGSPSATFQWLVSTDGGATYNPISDNSTYSGSTSNVLVVKTVSSMTGYEYEVQISNSCITLTSSPPARLTSNITSLPVTWLYFDAYKRDQSAILHWGTASETDSKDFIVKHSIDCEDWTTIGDVDAAGNSDVDKNYSLTDNGPVAGVNYYQIVQRDEDGNSTLSAIVSVDFSFNNPAGFAIYPNPIEDGKLRLVLEQAGDLNLYNSLGVLILTKALPNGLNVIDLSNLSKGIYEVKVGNESKPIIIR